MATAAVEDRCDFGTFAGRLRWTLEQCLGVTQSEVARRAGVSRQILNRWASDPTLNPEAASIEKLAAATGVSCAWLHYGEGDPPAIRKRPTWEAAMTTYDQNKVDDRQVVADFLRAVEGYSGAAVKTMVPGVTESDVSRWRSGKWERLSNAKRATLQEWLAAQGFGAFEGVTTTAPQHAIPDYKSFDLDFPHRDLLTDSTGPIFDRFVVGLIAKGIEKERIVTLGGVALASIVELHKMPGFSDRPIREIAVIQARFLNALIRVIEADHATPPPPSESIKALQCTEGE